MICRYCQQNDWGKRGCNRCGGPLPEPGAVSYCDPRYRSQYLDNLQMNAAMNRWSQQQQFIGGMLGAGLGQYINWGNNSPFFNR